MKRAGEVQDLIETVCAQAIQLHGGIGMTEEYLVGHYFKRAVVADLQLGSSEQHEAAYASGFTSIRGLE